MPIKIGIIASVVFIGLGFSVYSYRNEKKTMRPASNLLQSKFSSKGAIDRIIQLKLNYNEVESNSEKVEVTAEIQMPFDFSDKLYFRWKLGQDVFLTDGDLTGEIHGLLQNQIKKVSVSVTGFSKESNHHIGFEIYGIKNGKNIHSDALIASDIENTFENTVQNVERIKASQ